MQKINNIILLFIVTKVCIFFLFSGKNSKLHLIKYVELQGCIFSTRFTCEKSPAFLSFWLAFCHFVKIFARVNYVILFVCSDPTWYSFQSQIELDILLVTVQQFTIAELLPKRKERFFRVRVQQNTVDSKFEYKLPFWRIPSKVKKALLQYLAMPPTRPTRLPKSLWVTVVPKVAVTINLIFFHYVKKILGISQPGQSSVARITRMVAFKKIITQQGGPA